MNEKLRKILVSLRDYVPFFPDFRIQIRNLKGLMAVLDPVEKKKFEEETYNSYRVISRIASKWWAGEKLGNREKWKYYTSRTYIYMCAKGAFLEVDEIKDKTHFEKKENRSAELYTEHYKKSIDEIMMQTDKDIKNIGEMIRVEDSGYDGWLPPEDRYLEEK
jgi:hypothetical protein